MNQIFSVTDALGISREAIEVPLFPAGKGSVEQRPDGKFIIVIPTDQPLSTWLPALKSKLVALQ